jgi:hypothetical protein
LNDFPGTFPAETDERPPAKAGLKEESALAEGTKKNQGPHRVVTVNLSSINKSSY